MLTRALAFAGTMFLLTSCLLNQSPPTQQPPPATPPALVGFVGMQDVRGAASGAGITAIFGRQAAATTHRMWGVVTGRYFGVPEKNLRDAQTVGAGQCAIDTQAKPQPSANTDSPSDATGDATTRGATLIDVGALSYGAALQNAFVPFQETSDHQYSANLPLGYPSGLYEIQAAGTGDIPAFGEILSIPETLQNVTANGVPFENAPLKIKRSETLSIQWRTPVAVNASSQLLLEIDTANDTQLITLHCGGYETDFFPASGASSAATLRWDIPATVLSGLVSVKTANIFFVRGHQRKPQGQVKTLPVAIQLQGLRTYFTQAEIDD